MKVFVSTKQGQGVRENDFSHLDDGVLLTFAMVCDSDKDNPDGRCGCNRCLSGVEKGGGTTTFTVADQEITREEYIQRHKDYFVLCGWDEYMSQEEIDQQSEEDVDELLRLADNFDVGEVLEKRGDVIQVRQIPGPKSVQIQG